MLPLTFSRRDFLRAGALGVAGPTLADLLRCEASASSRRPRPKSIIYIVLAGGPSHLDMWDPKPDAPAEYRGPFTTIRTALPGVVFTQHQPKQAKLMDRLALIRGIRSVENDHFLSEVYTGLARTAGQRPAFGSVVSRLAPAPHSLPSYVSLDAPTTDQFEFEKPHYAGAGHAPFRPFGDAVENLKPVLSVERLRDRRELLRSFDSLNRELDTNGTVTGLDEFNAKALQIMTSPKVRDAFDLSKEHPRTRESYGAGKYQLITVRDHWYTWDTKPFILARRLVEAGVRVVTLRVGAWDHHSNLGGSIFHALSTMVPLLDHSFCALVEDLRQRGLEDDVLVVMLGEFGRTPKISQPGPGREHWADAGCAVFAGGGLKMGQVVGETDQRGERSKTGNITMQSVMSTIYHVLGIDPITRLNDFRGRPQHLLEDREPIAELNPPTV
jgi:hypothetical protein